MKPIETIVGTTSLTKTATRPEVRRKTVHIVLKDGVVMDAFANTDIDVVVYDLDCPDPDMRAEVEASVAQLADFAHEVEIF